MAALFQKAQFMKLASLEMGWWLSSIPEVDVISLSTRLLMYCSHDLISFWVELCFLQYLAANEGSKAMGHLPADDEKMS